MGVVVTSDDGRLFPTQLEKSQRQVGVYVMSIIARHANLTTTQRYIEGDNLAKRKVVDSI